MTTYPENEGHDAMESPLTPTGIEYMKEQNKLLQHENKLLIAKLADRDKEIERLGNIRQQDHKDLYAGERNLETVLRDNNKLLNENTQLRNYMNQMSTDNARMKGYVDRVRELERKPAHNPGPNDLVEVPRFVADTYMRNTAGKNIERSYLEETINEDWYTRGSKV